MQCKHDDMIIIKVDDMLYKIGHNYVGLGFRVHTCGEEIFGFDAGKRGSSERRRCLRDGEEVAEIDEVEEDRRHRGSRRRRGSRGSSHSVVDVVEVAVRFRSRSSRSRIVEEIVVLTP